MDRRLESYDVLYADEIGKRSDTHGVFMGGDLAALCVVINSAFEEAARAIERNLTHHGKRRGGSDTADAARRVDIATVRALKMNFADKWKNPQRGSQPRP